MDVRRHWWWRSASSKMKVCICCIVVLTMLGTGACSTLVTAPLNGTATIPCNAPQSETEKRPLEVYWQKKSLPSSDVVLVTLDGQEVSEHQTKKYVNRARQDPNYLVLYLDQVTVADEGTYECIVNHIPPGEFRKLIYKAEVPLKVLANFSSPELTQEPEGKVKNGTTVTLTCFSKEGYPAPNDVVLIVSSGNGNTELKGAVQMVQDTSTKLFNITGTFTLNFTGNVNLRCTIHQAESLGSVSSRTVSLEEEIAESYDYTVWIILAVLVCVGSLAGLLITMYYKSSKLERPKAESPKTEDLELPDGGRGEQRSKKTEDQIDLEPLHSHRDRNELESSQLESSQSRLLVRRHQTGLASPPLPQRNNLTLSQ